MRIADRLRGIANFLRRHPKAVQEAEALALEREPGMFRPRNLVIGGAALGAGAGLYHYQTGGKARAHVRIDGIHAGMSVAGRQNSVASGRARVYLKSKPVSFSVGLKGYEKPKGAKNGLNNGRNNKHF